MTTERAWKLIKGTKFLFNVNGHDVVAWSSALSGLKKVFLNDELISERRSFRAKSVLTFPIDNVKFEIRFLESFGNFGACELLRDECLVQKSN